MKMSTPEEIIAQILLEGSINPIIRNAGIFRFMPDYRFEKHNHKEIEIVYIRSGCCIMGVEERFIPLREGDCIVLCPGVPHWFSVDRSVSCQIAQLEFVLENLWGTGAEFAHFLSGRFYEFSDCSMVKEQIESICRCCRHMKESRYGNVRMKLMFLQLLMELSLKIEEENAAAWNGRIAAILAYINENYEYGISVEGLAQKFGISSRYLRKQFQAETGIGCSKYIMSLRIEKAKGLLWNSSKTVTEIASSTGFNSSQYFSRVFSRYTGQTPVEYRNSWRGRKAEESYFAELDKEEQK